MKKNVAIILAGGQGKRFGKPEGKQLANVLGKPMLYWTLSAFQRTKSITEIILVINSKYRPKIKNMLDRFDKVKKIVTAGKRRQDSVYNGLKEVSSDTDFIAIHDGARPCIESKEIEQALAKAYKLKAVVVGVPVKDTVKQVGSKGKIRSTPDRSVLWAAQTPQIFEAKLIRKAYDNAMRKSYTATDDAMMVEYIGKKVYVVKGSYKNIKVTTLEDLEAVKIILKGEKCC